MRYDKGFSNALPVGAYRDPADYLQSVQERSCTGCKFLANQFNRDFCLKTRKVLTKCKLFIEVV